MPEYPTGVAGFSASDQKGNLIAPRGADLHPLKRRGRFEIQPLAVRGGVSNATLSRQGLGYGGMGSEMANSEILLTDLEIADFARAGDKTAQERVVDELLMFLQSLDNLPDDLMRAMYTGGVILMSKSARQLLIERLQEKEVKHTRGKTNKSGRELFCSFLSPKKPTASHREQFEMALFAWKNLRPNGRLARNDESFEKLAVRWNEIRRKGCAVLRQFKEGRIELATHMGEISSAQHFANLPFATKDTFKRAWLKFHGRFDRLL